VQEKPKQALHGGIQRVGGVRYMALRTDEIISTLNELIETCKDGERGFREAAEAIDEPRLRSLFDQYSQQRSEFARELQFEVTSLGGSPERSGSMAGAMHRGWINLKSAVTGKDRKAIIAEAERGEDIAVKTYREALARGLPDDLASIIERQYRRILEAHDTVRSLELEAESTERTMRGGGGGSAVL
jgi:uncharacterized protein (TIGR02284 family)